MMLPFLLFNNANVSNLQEEKFPAGWDVRSFVPLASGIKSYPLAMQGLFTIPSLELEAAQLFKCSLEQSAHFVYTYQI